MQVDRGVCMNAQESKQKALFTSYNWFGEKQRETTQPAEHCYILKRGNFMKLCHQC